MQDIPQDRTTAVVAHALAYARRGWPMVVLEPGGKKVAYIRRKYAHGVDEATTDINKIKSVLFRVQGGNLGIACGGRGGPTVQDFDDLEHEEARSALAGIDKATTPAVATPGGWHFYFAGAYRNWNRPWGELRSTGYYVVAPPSVIDSGAYRWTVKPNGTLPELPAHLVPTRDAGTGCGDYQAPTGRVPHGQRHSYLVRFATLLVKGGITDRACLEAHLWCEFHRVCEPLPEPQTIPGIAKWAARSDIAQRENAMAELAEISPFWRKAANRA